MRSSRSDKRNNNLSFQKGGMHIERTEHPEGRKPRRRVFLFLRFSPAGMRWPRSAAPSGWFLRLMLTASPWHLNAARRVNLKQLPGKI